MEDIKDICVIGGGINGTGIAADASGRGLSVILMEQNDLSSGTSSHSTKLIHGGLRYLEFFEFKLVRNALREREVLMRKAPHLIFPLQFILPYEKHLRPAWMIRFGLFLYDHLAKRLQIPSSSTLKLNNNILKNEFKKGFSYYDCATDDARLVLLNAISAKNNHADILTHTEFISAVRENHLWKIILFDRKSQKQKIFYAKALINAAGPWVAEVNKRIQTHLNIQIKLVKGSHIVIPKLYDGDFAYILQNKDDRIVFAIPYQRNFTLIGTTDVLVKEPNEAIISEKEKTYLCDTINNYFQKNISVNDIVWSYSGIRCLQANHEKPSKTSRDYKLLIEEENYVPLINVLGGKITTFRVLSEDVLNRLKPFFPHMGPAWTKDTTLPGGDFPNQDFREFCFALKRGFPFLPEELLLRYATNYGTLCFEFLKNTKEITDLGEDFGAGLYAKEVEYLIQHEWAKTIEDILWRRTKLGLHKDKIEMNKLILFLQSKANVLVSE